jgi:hypothetical protein
MKKSFTQIILQTLLQYKELVEIYHPELKDESKK